MKFRFYLLPMLLLVLFAACKKDSTNNDNSNNNNNNNNNNSSYNTIDGGWYWMQPQFLHLESNYAEVTGAWDVDGTIMAYIVENVGQQYVGQLKYYSPADTAWHGQFSDFNAHSQLSFAKHQGKLYMTSNRYDQGFTYEFSGATATELEQEVWNVNMPRIDTYLGSSGTDLYRVRVPYTSTQDTIRVDRFDGSAWQPDTVFGTYNVYSPDIKVMSATDKVYIVLPEQGTTNYHIYTYSGSGTLTEYASFDYMTQYNKPEFFVYNDQLYALATATNSTEQRHNRIVSIEPGGDMITVIEPGNNQPYIFEAQPTTAGIVYTQGDIVNGAVNSIAGGVMRWDGSAKPDYFPLAPDTTSPVYTPGVGTLAGPGIYLGAYFFMHNGQLYAVGNGHVGVFGATGQPAAKTYMFKYNTY